MSATPCPSEVELRRFLLGESAEDAGPLGEHLESCAACVAVVRSLEQADPLLRALRGPTGRPDPSDVLLIRQIVEKATPAQHGETSSDSATGKGTKAPQPAEGGPATSSQPPVTSGQSGSADQATLSQGQRAAVEVDLAAILAPPQADDELGRLGQFRVLKVLGKGGMGVVLLAHDPALDRLVALKAMLPAQAARDAGKQRFLREARAAAAVRHDHIVVIHHVGEDRGVPFFAMEHLEGETLEKRLRRDGALPLAEVLRIGAELARALAAAHAKHLIHRDVKPSNIWLEAGTGRVKVLDFGLVRAGAQEGQLTGDGGWLGTPPYMAPEQILDPAHAEAAADLFSLGCVLYEMNAGTPPFNAQDAISVKVSGKRRPPVSPRQHNAALPAAFTALVLQLLNPEADKRTAGAAAVAEQLQRLAVPPPPRRRPLLWAACLLLPLLLTLVAVLLIIRTPAGEVTVETDDPNIELIARGGDFVRIRDLKAGTELTLNAGKYTLAMTDNPNGLTMDLPDGSPIVIRRAGAKVVTITRKLPPTAPLPAVLPMPPVAPVPPTPLVALDPGRRTAADDLDRRSIPKAALASAGGGDPKQAPPELVAILGDCRFRTLGAQGFPTMSPDGKWVAATCGQRIRLFDAATGQNVRDLNGHSHNVYRISFNPDGTLLASAGFFDTRVMLWQVATGQVLHTLEGHKQVVCGLAFSPNGRTLVSGDTNGDVRSWDVGAGTLRHARQEPSAAEPQPRGLKKGVPSAERQV